MKHWMEKGIIDWELEPEKVKLPTLSEHLTKIPDIGICRLPAETLPKIKKKRGGWNENMRKEVNEKGETVWVKEIKDVDGRVISRVIRGPKGIKHQVSIDEPAPEQCNPVTLKDLEELWNGKTPQD